MYLNFSRLKKYLIILMLSLFSLNCLAKDDLTFANFRDIRDLNPHLYSGEMWAQNMLFESLVHYNEDGSFSPWLAESWSISNDSKTYTFKLRQDVTFSDGAKFDAHSAKLNWDAVLANKVRHTWLEMVRLITEVKAVDDYTLQVNLSEPYYPFLIEIAVTRPMRFISPNSMINGTTKDGVKSYIGTGPYVLGDHKKDQYAVFNQNPTYWGSKPPIKTITMKVIADNQSRLLALENGEIDLIYGQNMVDADSFERFSHMDNFQTLISKPVSSRMVLLNTTRAILKDANVRRALEHIINKNDISTGIFNGSEAPADTLMATNIPYANIGLKPYQYDPKLASQLLDAAGWIKVAGQDYRYQDGKPFEITLYYNSNATSQKTIAQYMQDEFAQVGLKLNIHGEEEQGYSDRLKIGDFDMVFDISWGMPYDPQSFLASMKLPVHGDYMAQQGLAEKAQIDASISKALIATDDKTRQQLYAYVLETLHNEAVYIPLTYERNRAIAIKSLQGIEFAPSQFDIPFTKMHY
ncbi:nickel ABC transporter, nickel/metallophore periplasmic binding protein [Gilliamella sp. wkB178]|uniref:nickel ABC transporter substrate-binding protein n=1 Tax=Gilliamella sp. wkB178 TaxID=3120259 RepID=UPI00080DE56A|nr:nickel ABC transporter substrate-binding protein [Gilliamella apicola]OCG08759.1 nickel ABC transporter, nickel/metallophore periplasmic binding protein [Gilliamella apicola]